MNDYLTFETYALKEEADKASELLAQAGIDSFIVDDPANLDSNFVGAKYNNGHSLKLAGQNFDKARHVLSEKTIIDLSEIDSDYFMLQFSDLELLDVRAKPEEWGIYNYRLAEELLKQKGIDGSKRINVIRSEHIDSMTQSKNADSWALMIAYTFMLLILFIPILWNMGIIGHFGYTLLPPWIGLILGCVYAYSKRTLPDGTRIYQFNRKTRIHGRILFYGTLLGLLLLMFVFNENVRPLFFGRF